ncbi:MAG: hypothetical protein NTV01_11280 [Bacteroidia bacterium]|nr:hypothetical protein [Bacteroidia bacterium]
MKKETKLLIGLLLLGLITLFLVDSSWFYTLRASGFVRSNIKYHKSIERKLINSKGEETTFDPYRYPTLYRANAALDSMLGSYTLVSEEISDRVAIPDKELKKHIRQSIHSWRNSPFARHVSFTQFREYILPYRAGNEPYTAYSDEIIRKYSWIYDSLVNNPNPVEAVTLINEELKSWLAFDLRSHADLNEPGILEILKQKRGSCNSLTQFAAQTCRTFGIPVAIDECPFWAHRNSGHSWNVVLDTLGKWVPFGGAETNPFEFTAINDSVKVPKIYRHLFSKNPLFQPPFKTLTDIPALFRSPNLLDVTDEYVETSSVTIHPGNSSGKGKRILYLAVFNSNEWCIVAWSNIKRGKARFAHLGNHSIVYLPVYYLDGRIIPAAPPFVLTPEKAAPINPDSLNVQNVALPLYNKFYAEDWKTGFPEASWELELLYWNNRWVSVGKTKTDQELLKYRNIPSNELYLLRFTDKANTWQRIFKINNGEQVWY